MEGSYALWGRCHCYEHLPLFKVWKFSMKNMYKEHLYSTWDCLESGENF